jgi:membrane protease YdiL (CAAX protease family)
MAPRPLLAFIVISVGTTTAIASLTASMGWTVTSPAWGLVAPIAMWAPAVGSLVARRSEHPRFTTGLPLGHWGMTGWQVILVPLAMPLAVYGAAYAIASSAGLAQWSPGGGQWTTGSQIAANLIINLSILGVVGTFTALGEEIGWRGYLQPRLDAAGVRASVVVVWLIQVAYHAPLMVGAEYSDVAGLGISLALFAMGDLPVSFIMAKESYRARSLWPAVFFHSFHNTISQWLFPKFFSVASGQPWLNGEAGVLPMAGYILVGAGMYLWMRWRGQSWHALASDALAARPIRDNSYRAAAAMSG